MRLGYESEDGAQGDPQRDTENVGIGKRIAKQGLEAGASNGKRRANDNRQENTWQTDFDHDHGIVAGELAGLAEQNADQVMPKAVERNLDGAQPEGDDYHDKQNYGENAALEEQALPG